MLWPKSISSGEKGFTGKELDTSVGRKLRQEAGLASDGIKNLLPKGMQKTLLGNPKATSYKNTEKVKGLLSMLTRKGPLSTFGQTTGRRVGRGAPGLAAAGIPALAGAFLSNDPSSN